VYKWSLVQLPADVYVVPLAIFSLFIADVMPSIEALMSARWIHDGAMTTRQFCIAQGVIQQLSESFIGLATMLIAVHTFASVWMRKQCSIGTTAVIIGVVVSWTFIVLFVGIASGIHKNYDGTSPRAGPDYWQYKFWVWLTLFVTIEWRASGDTRNRPRTLPLVLLAYPILYFILVLPVAVWRWITFSNRNVAKNRVSRRQRY